jgi:hypothetical protein
VFQIDEGQVCCMCGKFYEATESLRKFDFCSLACEAEWAESEQQCVLRVRGRMPRIGFIDGEKFTFVANAPLLVKEIRDIDLFTFLQHPRRVGLQYPQYRTEIDNLAIVPISTFECWWTRQVDAKTRNMVRKAEKKQVELRETACDEEFIRGLCDIYNETPVRQGRKFPHYGMTESRAREYAGSFPSRSIFIGAYFEGKLCGFLKMVMDHARSYACILHILSKIEHRDKAPTNALIAAAVRSCADRGISQLAYDRFQYGHKVGDSLSEFKANNGFERVDVPRYYVPMNIRGEIGFRLGLHRKLVEVVPEWIAAPLRDMRSQLLKA